MQSINSQEEYDEFIDRIVDAAGDGTDWALVDPKNLANRVVAGAVVIDDGGSERLAITHGMAEPLDETVRPFDILRFTHTEPGEVEKNVLSPDRLFPGSEGGTTPHAELYAVSALARDIEQRAVEMESQKTDES